MFKSKFLKVFLILVFIVGSLSVFGYALRVRRGSFSFKSKDSELKNEVRELLIQVPSVVHIMPDGGLVALDTEEIIDLETGKTYNPNIEARDKLVASGEKVVPILMELYEDRSENDELMDVLGRIGSDRAVEFLISILQSQTEKPNIRAGAARALGKSNNPKAQSALISSSLDENPIIRKFSREALKEMNQFR